MNPIVLKFLAWIKRIRLIGTMSKSRGDMTITSRIAKTSIWLIEFRNVSTRKRRMKVMSKMTRMTNKVVTSRLNVCFCSACAENLASKKTSQMIDAVRRMQSVICKVATRG